MLEGTCDEVMMNGVIRTERLILRPWKDEDFEAFAKINADPRVMEFFPSLLTRKESDEMAQKIKSKIEEEGWGLFAVSIPSVADFAGFIGLWPVTFPAPFTPAVEVGWRLGHDYWGNGYAVEGAKVALQLGFEILQLDEIVSFTSAVNKRSTHIMTKLGMHHSPADDFDHPAIPEGNPLRRHVLYRLTHEEWEQA